MRPFSDIAPSKLKIKKKKLRVDNVYIEESFKAIFYIGYGSVKSPIGYRVQKYKAFV